MSIKIMAACATSRPTIGPNNTDSNDSLRVKMVKDARRKQQWVETLTPPRSPLTEDLTESEPIIDDLWELWTGAGLDELDQDACTIDNALNELGFTTDEESDIKPFNSDSYTSQRTRRVSINVDFDEDALFNSTNGLGCDAEDLLDHLFQFVDNDSPPPTNPPSPPGPGDSETVTLEAQSYTNTYVNYTNSTGSISSSSSSTGDVEDNMQTDEGFISSQNSPLGVGEDKFLSDEIMKEETNLFDSNFNILDPKFNIFDDDFGKDLKHDCMWNGGCCTDSSSLGLKICSDPMIQTYSTSPKFDDLKFDFPKTKIKVERDDSIDIKDEPIRSVAQDEEMNWGCDPFSMFMSEENSNTDTSCQNSSSDSDQDSFKNLEWSTGGKKEVSISSRIASMTPEELEELELRRIAAINDHSYANPIMPDPNSKPFTKPEPLKKGIQAIVLPEENGDDYSGGPKKTKILVPLKDLMDSLQHKTFLVAPLGPGKKVIRLTGSETVKGMLGVHHQALTSSTLKSVSSYCVPQQSLFNRSSNNSSSSNSHLPSSNPRPSKKSKVSKQMLREGGTITFPNQFSPTSPTPSSSSTYSSSSSSASNKPKKAKTHNNMERMRRIDLRNSFDHLKKLVPPLAKSPKCSKVEILKRAEEYIRALRSLEKRLIREEATVRARNEQLKSKLLHTQNP